MRIGRTAAGVIATQGREECRTDDGAGRNPGQCVGVWAALGLLTTHTTKNAYREHTDKKCMPSESVNKSYVFCLLSDSKGETLSRTRSHRPKSEGQQQSPTTTRDKPKDLNREMQSRERQARQRQPDTQEPCPRSPHEGTGENIPPSRNPSPAGRWSVSERNRAQGSGTKTPKDKNKKTYPRRQGQAVPH